MGSESGESILSVLFRNFDVLALPVVSLLYPLIPIWPYVKLILLCWLVIPYFSGAAFVYKHFVNPQTVNVWYIPKKKNVFRKQDDIRIAADILTATEKYIEENGTEAFKTLISKLIGKSSIEGAAITWFLRIIDIEPC